MTVVVSIVRPSAVIMANDSAVTYDFASHSEYDTGRKAYNYPGLGIVTTWGARDANRIGQYLADQRLDPLKCDVEDLATAVHRYLTSDYRPADHRMGDVGYHSGGFTRAGDARLYHSYWNTKMAAEARTEHAGYRLERHAVPKRNTIFMYNGRDDLAKTVIDTLFEQLRLGRPVRFKRSFAGFASLCNFVLRFATEITPPFITHIINRHGMSRNHIARDMTRVSEEEFLPFCADLGLDPKEGPDDGGA